MVRKLICGVVLGLVVGVLERMRLEGEGEGVLVGDVYRPGTVGVLSFEYPNEF